MSSYVRRAMQANEKILYQAQIHWVIYLDGIFFMLIGALLGSYRETLVTVLVDESMVEYLSTPLKYMALGLVAYGSLDMVMSFIRQIATELVITNQRVIAKTGLIATTSYELMMSKVEGATIDQSTMGRIMNYGTLMIKGTGGGTSPIDLIAKPFEFHNRLMSAIHAAHQERE